VLLRADLVSATTTRAPTSSSSRRIFDSITPGWEQVGAVWLPLPHLINAIPVQIDVFYQTGAFASLISIACFGITATR
jgi:hypothetical protein